MSVLVEAISIIVRLETLRGKYPGSATAYRADCPNATYCEDDLLSRVGFMRPADVEKFVERLEEIGFVHLADGMAVDLVVVEQGRGPTSRCNWLEGGHHPDGYSAVWLAGTVPGFFCHPTGWTFSQSGRVFHVEPPDVAQRFLNMSGDNGVDAYLDYDTGREVYQGKAFDAAAKAADDEFLVIVAEAVESYQSLLETVHDQLLRDDQLLEKPLLLERREALQVIVSQFRGIKDVPTARLASAALAQRIEGMQPATIAHAIGLARRFIIDNLLPVRLPVPTLGARALAVRFLADEINTTDRAAIREIIEDIGLAQFQLRHHMPFGIGVRNKLREEGFSEELLGAPFDDMWAILVYEAVILPPRAGT